MSCPICRESRTLESLRDAIPDPYQFVTLSAGMGGGSNDIKATPIGEPSTCASCGVRYNPRAATLRDEYEAKVAPTVGKD